MPDKFSIQEFAAQIRERRPDLAHIPDMTLVGKMIQGFPELKENLDTSPAQPNKVASTSDDRSAVEVAEDQAAHVLEGIPKAITGLPAAAINIAKSGYDLLHGDVSGAGHILKDMASPVTTSVRGAAALVAPGSVKAPSRQEFESAAEGAGANLGGILVGEAAGAGVQALAKRFPRLASDLYQEGLKPKPRMYSNPDIKAMVRTGIENKIPISDKGLTKLKGLVDDLNKSIESDISKHPYSPISKMDVVQRLRDPFQQASKQVNPLADEAAIRESGAEFVKTQPNTITAESAQELKKGTYKKIGERPYEREQNPAGTAAQMALARGLKEELQNIFPEIQGKNAAEGALLELQPELEAAVNRLGNKPTMSRVWGILKDPAITSRLAIAVHNAGLPTSAIADRLGTVGGVTGPIKSRREAMDRLQPMVAH